MPYKDLIKRKEYMKKYYLTKEGINRKRRTKEPMEIRKIRIKACVNAHRRRKSYCEICGDNSNLQFHHWDYKRNIGNTLCKFCHKVQHKTNLKGGLKYGIK